jgi:hypothetical protein
MDFRSSFYFAHWCYGFIHLTKALTTVNGLYWKMLNTHAYFGSTPPWQLASAVLYLLHREKKDCLISVLILSLALTVAIFKYCKNKSTPKFFMGWRPTVLWMLKTLYATLVMVSLLNDKMKFANKTVYPRLCNWYQFQPTSLAVRQYFNLTVLSPKKYSGGLKWY